MSALIFATNICTCHGFKYITQGCCFPNALLRVVNDHLRFPDCSTFRRFPLQFLHCHRRLQMWGTIDKKAPPPPPTDCEFSDALITKCLTNSCRSQNVLKAHHGTFLKTRCPVTQTLWKLATKVLSAFESAFQVESDFPWAQKGNVLPPSVLWLRLWDTERG